jgi:hypothetical protein
MLQLSTFRSFARIQTEPSSFRVFWRVRLAALLSIILSIIFLTGSCTFPWDANASDGNGGGKVIDTHTRTLDQQSLVRELVTCLSDTSKIESVYNSIPSKQLDGISVALFGEYITALTHFQNQQGVIKTFRIVSDQDKKILLDQIAQNSHKYEDIIGASIPVELTYVSELTSVQPVYIYIQADSNGTPYLSQTWVQACMDIYDFSALYFQALEEQNEEAVASMINRSQVPLNEAFSDAVIQFKAKELGKFYHVNVKSAFADYQILSFDVSQMTYLQPEVLNEITLSSQAKVVRFVRDSLNNITIKDSVSDPLSSKDFYLYYQGAKDIRIGDRADSKQFQGLFGDPIIMLTGELITLAADPAVSGSPVNGTGPVTPTPAEGPEQVRNIVLSYSSASITIRGNVYDDGSWDGQIIRIRLRADNQDFYLGENIHAGMTRNDLLMVYPFADQTDYLISTTVDDQKYEMSFEFSVDNPSIISGVKLEMANP